MNMLAQLLSSKPKTKLVNLFLGHPARSFSATELRSSTGCGRKLLAKTLKELEKMGFLLIHKSQKVRYFQINKYFALYPELVSLLRKIKKIPKDLLAEKIKRVGELKFAALTGVFSGKPRLATDLLLVGKASPTRLKKLVALAQRFAEKDIRFTVMDAAEFEYRQAMNDRFIKDILENIPVVIIDKTRNRSIAKLVYKL